jgi:hypothetical protein
MIMKTTIISYSLTGNNATLAASIAKELGAEHIKIVEAKSRTTGTIFFDILFNRTPKVNPMPGGVGDSDLVIFVAPVWMGQVATPLRAYFRYFKDRPANYAFVSISGGADGPNPKLAAELSKRMGKEPAALIDMHIANLFPPDPKPTREVTMAYRLKEAEVKGLTEKIVRTLREIIVR